jgi:hypothetical protein
MESYYVALLHIFLTCLLLFSKDFLKLNHTIFASDHSILLTVLSHSGENIFLKMILIFRFHIRYNSLFLSYCWLPLPKMGCQMMPTTHSIQNWFPEIIVFTASQQIYSVSSQCDTYPEIQVQIRNKILFTTTNARESEIINYFPIILSL